MKVDPTKKSELEVCLEKIKQTDDEEEIKTLTDELAHIVFERQYKNGECVRIGHGPFELTPEEFDEPRPSLERRS
jgi:hypothetical protein